ALSRRRRWWPLYSWGLSCTDRILVQHGGQLSALPARWRAKARITPSMAVPKIPAQSHWARASYGSWVAMLRQPKRLDLLIEIARRRPDILFVVCGGASTHRSPQEYGERMVTGLRALPNVEFLGQVPPDKALQVIENAAVLLSTSAEEGFPNTFL